MNNIPNISLEDTYNLIQLMRETALARGQTDQAEKLSPVMNEMRELVKTNHSTASSSAASPAGATSAPSGMMAQSDFQKLLEISKGKSTVESVSDPVSAVIERNRLVNAMSSANMSDLEIAKQLGMTREEVNLVLNTTPKSAYSGGIK